MHFLHKTFPGTIDKISQCAKFHSSSCLISWLPKIRSCSLANWESTFFSQSLALLNISFTVHKLYTWLIHPKQLFGMPDMSLVSLTGFWCPWQRGNNQTDLCETTQCSPPLYTVQCIFELAVIYTLHQNIIYNVACQLYLLYSGQDNVVFTTNSVADPGMQEDDPGHQINLVNTSSSTARFLS